RDALTQQCARSLGALQSIRPGERAVTPFLTYIEEADSFDVDHERANDVEAHGAIPFVAGGVFHRPGNVSVFMHQCRDALAHVPVHDVAAGLRAHLRNACKMGVAGTRLLAELA